MPDPIETRLGRAFDLELAALISAFQTQGYVLDAFALAWTPRKTEASDDANLATSTAASPARKQPSLLLFRKDEWRMCKSSDTSCPPSTYYALFLVGETPTSGVHREAFRRAARCALALDGRTYPNEHCDTRPPVRTGHLDVIGPSFSGSIESIAAALGDVVSETPPALRVREIAPQLAVTLLTPTASVDSNKAIHLHPFVSSLEYVAVDYQPLASSVQHQLETLLTYLGKLPCSDNVVLLAEESSFGNGAAAIATEADSEPFFCPRDRKQRRRLIPVQFPPNIAAIRAEHARQQRERDTERRTLIPSRLLELDLRGVERGSDLPPVYQPSLSSRSDELMLYQTFDALNRYVHPAAAVIVATDVRDRLYMLNQVRYALPDAVPVVLEQDNLLVHPDYRRIARGTLVIPGGDTLVCLDSGTARIASCWNGDGQARRRYFSFPTDYAANMFRAAVLLLTGDKPQEQRQPQMLVATLAGFQGVQAGGRNILVASDARRHLRRPLYLALVSACGGLLIVAVWTLSGGGGDRIALALPRNLLRAIWSLTTWVKTLVKKWVLRASPSTPNNEPAPTDPRRLLGYQAGATWLMGVWATTALLIALCRLFFPDKDLSLVHGRDFWALVCIVLVFAAVAMITLIRLDLWNRRCRAYLRHAALSRFLGMRTGGGGSVPSLALAVIFVVALYVCLPNKRPAASADSTLASMLAGFGLLGAGAFFLVLFWIQLLRWRRISQGLARTIKTVRRSVATGVTGVTELAEWPTPWMLDEPPRSPFNLVVEDADLQTLYQSDSTNWMENTASLIAGIWPFGDERSHFAAWQAGLVAEMKVASVAVRACAWCAVLGPAVALLLLQVYPPAFERPQVMAAGVLLTVSAAMMIVAALLLEKDRLLGRMFTRDEDRLSIGGAVSVIWPKLVGLGTLLATVFLPDVWDWLSTLGKVIKTIH